MSNIYYISEIASSSLSTTTRFINKGSFYSTLIIKEVKSAIS
jgi:hypothetical protein